MTDYQTKRIAIARAMGYERLMDEWMPFIGPQPRWCKYKIEGMKLPSTEDGLPDPLHNEADAFALMRWLLSQDVSLELWCDHVVARVWVGNARDELHYAEIEDDDGNQSAELIRAAIVDAAYEQIKEAG